MKIFNHRSLKLYGMWLAFGNLPLTNKNKYLKIHNSVIQSVMSREGLKLQACNFL